MSEVVKSSAFTGQTSTNENIFGMNQYLSIQEINAATTIFAVLVVALLSHVLARTIQFLSTKISSSNQSNRTKTIASLSVSVLIFSIYFIAFGLILQELGVSIGTYVASASVIGIAVGFGTQNVVQDIINGLTIIVTDLFTVGDMVEISGQTGIVKHVGMRFVVLSNPLGAKVYIPARTVTNVINYPRGYIRCLVDISLKSKDDLISFRDTVLKDIVHGVTEQFPYILRAEPEIEELRTVALTKHFIRVKFRIWPGRGAPIENGFKQDVVIALKTIDTSADANSVNVNYEISK